MTEAVSGVFTATAEQSGEAPRWGKFNVSLTGTWTGTVSLQRMFKGGAWETVKEYTGNVSEVAEEPEAGVKYSFTASNLTAGSAEYRIGPSN